MDHISRIDRTLQKPLITLHTTTQTQSPYMISFGFAKLTSKWFSAKGMKNYISSTQTTNYGGKWVYFDFHWLPKFNDYALPNLNIIIYTSIAKSDNILQIWQSTRQHDCNYIQCMKRPVAHSLNSTWFWIELPENCCEPLKFIMKYISIQFCERPGQGRPFHALYIDLL